MKYILLADSRVQRVNFLIDIGVDINTRRHPHDKSKFVLDKVMDKVVQDADDSEGTGPWYIP